MLCQVNIHRCSGVAKNLRQGRLTALWRYINFVLLLLLCKVVIFWLRAPISRVAVGKKSGTKMFVFS